MKLAYTRRVGVVLKDLPLPLRKAFYKQAGLLSKNLLHPSLHAKKYNEAGDLWQARINRDWRFYFTIQDDTYIITGVVRHPK